MIRVLSRRPRLLLAAALLAGAALFVGKRWKAVISDVHPARKVMTASERNSALAELPRAVDVTLHTQDGLTLRGWYAPGTNGAAIVFVHGVWSNRTALLPEAARLAEHGYGVFLYDSRASGDSDGDLCTWGDRERADVKAAVDYVAAQPNVGRLGAVGFSVGSYSLSGVAATDTRIRAMVLEGATPSLHEGDVWGERRYGAVMWYPVEVLYRAYGLRIEEISVVQAMKTMAPRPVLLAIGSDDPFIPPWMTDEILAAAPGPKSKYVVQGVGHHAYAVPGGEPYMDVLVKFFDDAIGPAASGRQG
jgi:dienelactone hydrolase